MGVAARLEPLPWGRHLPSALVAQRLEQPGPNGQVAGSIPAKSNAGNGSLPLLAIESARSGLGVILAGLLNQPEGASVDRSQLTQRQAEILSFIEAFIRENGGRSPTYRMVMDHFGFTSPNSVMVHTKALKRKGFLVINEKGRHGSFAIPGLEMVPSDEVSALKDRVSDLEMQLRLAGSK